MTRHALHSGDDFHNKSAVEVLPITSQIIKPRDCAIAFGIPESGGEFRKRQGIYASFYSNWLAYDFHVAEPLNEFTALANRLGSSVLGSVTSSTLPELFINGIHKVVFFISHFDHGLATIELRDGWIPVDDFVKHIPSEFRGFLVTPCCRIEALGKAIRQQRPNCRLHYSDGENTPFVWFAFYRVFLLHIQRGDLTFFDALEQVIGAITARTDKRGQK